MLERTTAELQRMVAKTGPAAGSKVALESRQSKAQEDVPSTVNDIATPFNNGLNSEQLKLVVAEEDPHKQFE